MTTLLVAIGVALVAFLIAYFYFKQKSSDTGAPNQALLLLQNQIQALERGMSENLARANKETQESVRFQMTESQKLIKEITRELSEVKETGKQVIGFADQLQSLQDILKNPKQRGILGEYFLETLLKNTMPPGSYEMQYKLGKDDDGNELIPDAVVFVKDKIIPIDSKFSLENYNRIVEEHDPTERKRLEKTFENDLKKRITETAKYVQPSKGTMDFAFMFIPHEAIYYDLLIGKVGEVGEDAENLIQRAASKHRVIIVSPTSFLAYLQTVLQGLKALQIEEKAQDIIKHVEKLGTHIKSYEEYHGKLGNALGTVVNHYNTSTKELQKIDKDVLKLTGSSVGIESELLEKPLVE